VEPAETDRETPVRGAKSALFAVGLVVLPFSAAKAQYCDPIALPFCIAGAAVNTAAAIATAPFYAFAPAPYYYYGRPYYYGAGYYYPARRHYHRRHHRHY
jgi:hypothetical protein